MPVKAANSTLEAGVYDFACLRRRFHDLAGAETWIVALPNSDIDEETADEWNEIEQLGPRGQQLIRLVNRFPAPQDWD